MPARTALLALIVLIGASFTAWAQHGHYQHQFQDAERWSAPSTIPRATRDKNPMT